jgi:phosphosulfolactate synthase (CoM biosynthesis protein A)
MDFDEGALRKLIREETRNALKDIGLADDDADADIRDLRSLITDWRGIKKIVWQTVAKAGTMFVLGLLMLGAWAKFGGGSE